MMPNLSNLLSKNKSSKQNAGDSSGGEKKNKNDNTTGHDTSTSSTSTTGNKNKNGSQGTTTSTTGSTTPPGSPPKNPIKCKPEPPVKLGITTTITAGGHDSNRKRSSHTKTAEPSSLSFHSSLNPDPTDPDPAAAAASLALIQDKVNSAASALQHARSEERDAWKQLCAVDANHGLTSNSLIPAMWYPSYRKASKRHQRAREEVEAAKREMERAKREFGQF